MKTILAIAISLFLAAPMAWASDNVFANDQEITTRQAGGKSIVTFPDVLITPPGRPATPPGVPIPYPNGGKSSDTSKGAKQLYQGKAYFTPHALDAKVDGQEHFDPGPFCYHR